MEPLYLAGGWVIFGFICASKDPETMGTLGAFCSVGRQAWRVRQLSQCFRPPSDQLTRTSFYKTMCQLPGDRSPALVIFH